MLIGACNPIPDQIIHEGISPEAGASLLPSPERQLPSQILSDTLSPHVKSFASMFNRVSRGATIGSRMYSGSYSDDMDDDDDDVMAERVRSAIILS